MTKQNKILRIFKITQYHQPRYQKNSGYTGYWIIFQKESQKKRREIGQGLPNQVITIIQSPRNKKKNKGITGNEYLGQTRDQEKLTYKTNRTDVKMRVFVRQTRTEIKSNKKKGAGPKKI